MEKLLVRQVSWISEKSALQAVRTRVFVEEQKVPLELEWDDADENATHFLASLSNTPIGCARLLACGQIGRMAVLTEYRKLGIGEALLHKALRSAKEQGIKTIFLHAQNQAIPFYKKYDFKVEGNEFIDAGIPHHIMVFKPERRN